MVTTESQFDTACSIWLRSTRQPDTESLALVLERAKELLFAGKPCSATLFELAYRQLHNEGLVQLVTEPIKTAAPRSHLTAAEYNRLSVSEVRQRYSQDKAFAADVDSLIARKEIL
jgi:hypothetical protein